jgi:hypothetical protein
MSGLFLASVVQPSLGVNSGLRQHLCSFLTVAKDASHAGPHRQPDLSFLRNSDPTQTKVGRAALIEDKLVVCSTLEQAERSKESSSLLLFCASSRPCQKGHGWSAPSAPKLSLAQIQAEEAAAAEREKRGKAEAAAAKAAAAALASEDAYPALVPTSKVRVDLFLFVL